jgi:hypothetical protein
MNLYIAIQPDQYYRGESKSLAGGMIWLMLYANSLAKGNIREVQSYAEAAQIGIRL